MQIHSGSDLRPEFFNQERAIQATQVTKVGLVTNVLLTVFKLFAGIAGRSNAMLADGVHSLSDFATDVVLLVGFRLVAKPADQDHQYGHGKVETLVTSVVGVALFFVGAKILWSAMAVIIGTLHGHPLEQSPGWIAFYAAIISILSKEWLYRYTVRVGRKINSRAVIANAWHHRSDSLSSFGAMIGIGGAILLGQKWRILDPLAAVAVSVFILKVSFSISFTSINELIEASVNEETKAKILKIVSGVPGVLNPHKMKTRRIGNDIAIDIHIEVRPELSIVQAHEISSQVEHELKDTFGLGTFVYVHVEPFREA